MIDMFKVLDIYPIGNMLSVTLEGPCKNIKNGCKLIDSKGNIIVVVSTAMIHHNDSICINKNTVIIKIAFCQLKKDDVLFIV